MYYIYIYIYIYIPQNNCETINKMAISTCLSKINLHVNRLNAPIKRHRMAEWVQKQDPYICCLEENHQIQTHLQTESEGMENDIPYKWKSKESWSSNSHIRQNRL